VGAKKGEKGAFGGRRSCHVRLRRTQGKKKVGPHPDEKKKKIVLTAGQSLFPVWEGGWGGGDLPRKKKKKGLGMCWDRTGGGTRRSKRRGGGKDFIRTGNGEAVCFTPWEKPFLTGENHEPRKDPHPWKATNALTKGHYLRKGGGRSSPMGSKISAEKGKSVVGGGKKGTYPDGEDENPAKRELEKTRGRTVK